eukprot:g4980.t1
MSKKQLRAYEGSRKGINPPGADVEMQFELDDLAEASSGAKLLHKGLAFAAAAAAAAAPWPPPPASSSDDNDNTHHHDHHDHHDGTGRGFGGPRDRAASCGLAPHVLLGAAGSVAAAVRLDDELRCLACGAKNPKVHCGGCKVAHYCDRDCQRDHLERHRHDFALTGFAA